MNISNNEKSDTNQIILGNYSGATDDLSGPDLYSDASQPIPQQNKLLICQGSPSSADDEGERSICCST